MYEEGDFITFQGKKDSWLDPSFFIRNNYSMRSSAGSFCCFFSSDLAGRGSR